jgi:pimeloyl-ACP methyl ester carboxylesterase
MRRIHLSIPPFDTEGIVELPPDCRVVVVFAHGSGSSRFSPRNRAVAKGLHAFGLGTLLFDLLSPDEADDRANVFNIDLLARRLFLATAELRRSDLLRGLPIAYFGASTGAAAALTAAQLAGNDIEAIVSRGGRPDLAAVALPHVVAPTLLIVGGADEEVLELNRQALARMRCEKELAVISGATHLFEEPGALEQVVVLAGRWFEAHCPGLKP